MADGVFNIAKGKAAYYAGLPESSDALIAVLLVSSGLDADGTLEDFDTLEAVLAANTEASFSGYARKTLSNVSVTVDDTNDWVDVDCDDVSWEDAAAGQTIAKLLICYDENTGTGDDGDIIPLTHHDWSVETDGSTITATMPSGGFYRAAGAA